MCQPGESTNGESNIDSFILKYLSLLNNHYFKVS